MKANELRIGNLVGYDKRVFKIHSLAEIYPTLDTIEFGIGVVDWDNLKPIPLTEEWLLKFGFEFKDVIGSGYGYWYLSEQSIRFVLSKNGLHCSIGNDERGFLYQLIHYVHQLQNLYFALTGEELTIKE